MATSEKTFGQQLKHTRLMRRNKEGKLESWTQYHLHLASGVSESTICEIEQGKVVPQDITKAKLADALGAPALLDF